MKDLAIKEVAKKVDVHPNYLRDLEQGNVVFDISILVRTLESLGVNSKEKTYIADAFRNEITIEDKIKDVINLYYGKNLWTLRPQFDYEESIAPFVRALVGLGQNGQQVTIQSPTMPSLGNTIEIEEKNRKGNLDGYGKELRELNRSQASHCRTKARAQTQA